MYPIIRFITTCIHAFRSDRISIDGVAETSLRIRPWDIDMFLEVNNGRILTLYDLGRFDLSIRTGLAKALKENKWGLVVAGSTVRYRRRIRMFEKVTIYTQVVGYEDRWIYILQSMWVKGIPASSILLRTGITSQGKVIPARDVLEALDMTHWQPELHGWVKDWVHSEESRVWPPPKGRLARDSILI